MGATGTTITKEIAFVGMRVCRGKEWDYDVQDHLGGFPGPGKIDRIDTGYPEGAVYVTWDNGARYWYPIGDSERYALNLWEDDVIGTSTESDHLGEQDVVSIGDTLEFVRHAGDSKAGPLVHGQRIIVKDFNKHSTGANRLCTDATTWWYNVDCFKKVAGAVTITSPTPITSLKYGDVEAGDEVRLASHGIDTSGVLVVGGWYKVKSIGTTGVEVRRPEGTGWYVEYKYFDQVKKPAKEVAPKATRKRTLILSDIRIGDWLRMYEHKIDSEEKLKIGQWYQVEHIDPGVTRQPVAVTIMHSGSPAKREGNWFVSLECFDDLDAPSLVRMKNSDIAVGDMVYFNVRIGDAHNSEIPLYTWVEVIEKQYNLIKVKHGSNTHWMKPECLSQVKKKETSKVEEVRGKMETTVLEVKKTENVKCRIYSDGGVAWFKVPMEGETLVCTYAYPSEGYALGDRMTVGSATLDRVRKLFDSKYVLTAYFAPLSEGEAFLANKKVTTSATISSSIKTTENDRHTSSVIVSTGVNGSIFKIQKSHPKIREGQIGGFSAVRLRSGKAKIAG